MSRTDKAVVNIRYGYISAFLNLFLRFASRTVFVYTIGVTYLGVSGLFTNILSVLSLTELGVGTAMNFSLYKPVAEKNYEKIKALMNLYKKTFRLIAILVLVLGTLLFPFLKYIVKDPGFISQGELQIYYFIFLFNTVSSYFISYKYSLIKAEQKNYIITNINAISTIIITIFQVIVLLVFKSFLIYLITASIIELIQKIFINHYINKYYPYLLDKNVRKLSEEEIAPIKRNIKALIYHRLGDISINQTDNILISSFISITTVGVLSNYNFIIISVTNIINIIFVSTLSGFGNLIATEDIDKQYLLFKVYRFIGFWLYSFSTIAFLSLISPFIELWLGTHMLINYNVLYLILLNHYTKGHRIAVGNFKTAAGEFNADKYVPIISAITNLIISIVMVKKFGLLGIFIGTMSATLIFSFTRPIIVYKNILKRNAIEYYIDSIIYFVIFIISAIIMFFLREKILEVVNISNFIIMMGLVITIPNTIFVICFKNREEFQYLYNLMKRKIRL